MQCTYGSLILNAPSPDCSPRAIGCAEQSEAHRSRMMRLLSSAHPMTLDFKRRKIGNRREVYCGKWKIGYNLSRYRRGYHKLKFNYNNLFIGYEDMKNTLQIISIILTLFMLGNPIITHASQSSSTDAKSFAPQDNQIDYSTSKHQRKKGKN